MDQIWPQYGRGLKMARATGRTHRPIRTARPDAFLCQQADPNESNETVEDAIRPRIDRCRLRCPLSPRRSDFCPGPTTATGTLSPPTFAEKRGERGGRHHHWLELAERGRTGGGSRSAPWSLGRGATREGFFLMNHLKT
jgi:hypothetical protein